MEATRVAPEGLPQGAKSSGGGMLSIFFFCLLIVNGLFNFTAVWEVVVGSAICCAVIALVVAFMPKYREYTASSDPLSLSVLFWCLLVCVSVLWAANQQTAFYAMVGYAGSLFCFYVIRAGSRAGYAASFLRAIGYAGGLVSLLSIEMASTGFLRTLMVDIAPSAFRITKYTPPFGLWVEGARMQSLMGLPNLYATFAALSFFIMLAAGEGKKRRALDVIALTASGTGFFLAGSRGGLVAFAGACFLLVLFSKRGERRYMAAANGAIVIWCALTALLLQFWMGSGSFTLWPVLGVMCFAAHGSQKPLDFIAKKVQSAKVKTVAFLSAAAAVLGAGFLLMTLAPRLKSALVDGNLSGRFDFWRDGMKLFAQSPFAGLGGGAFETLSNGVSDYHYFTKHVHNHYIQVMLENGILGLIAMLATLFFCFSALWKARRGNAMVPFLAAAAGMMAIHSIVEASMQNLLNVNLFFMLLGVISGLCAKPSAAKGRRASPNRRSSSGLTKMGGGSKALLCVTAIVCIALFGGRLYTQAGLREAERKGFTQALSYYRWAVITDPLNAAQYKSACISRYLANPDPGAEQLVRRFAEDLEKNKNTPEHCYLAGRYHIQTGGAAAAAPFFERYVKLARMDAEVWDAVLFQYSRYIRKGDAAGIEAVNASVLRLKLLLADINKTARVKVEPDPGLLRVFYDV